MKATDNISTGYRLDPTMASRQLKLPISFPAVRPGYYSAVLGSAAYVSPHNRPPTETPSTVTSLQSSRGPARRCRCCADCLAACHNGLYTPPNSHANRGAQFTVIANVPYDTVRQDLVSEFRKYGRVELAMVVCDEASRHPHKEWTSTAGYAFVRFSKRAEAAAAIQAATMGLITIRGTRVRADWARKDSYAKRGRVSAAQGAPVMGPFGVPDGISLLQDSLNRAAKNIAMPWPDEATTKPDCAKPWSDKVVDNDDLVMQGLEKAFTLAFTNEPFAEEQPPCCSVKLSNHLPVVEDEQSAVVAADLASTLSPTSRGLLTSALSDVAFADAFTDVSPPASAQQLTPEALLRQALVSFASRINSTPIVACEPTCSSRGRSRDNGATTVTSSGVSDFSSSDSDLTSTDTSAVPRSHL